MKKDSRKGKINTMGINKKEYALLIEESKEMLYRIAYGYLGTQSLALDAVDEAVYLGFMHRKELLHPEYAKTWLTRILIHECYKLLKRQKREIVTESLPEKLYEEEFNSIPLKIAMQKLPEDLRKVIILRYFGGYTIQETSHILEIPEGTVSTRARKALSLLRVNLED